MYYEGFNTGDRIEISPTYRCQIHPMLNSGIMNNNKPGEWYPKHVVDPFNGIVESETLNGIWVTVELPVYEEGKKTGKVRVLKEFYEKDKFLFKKLLPNNIEKMLESM